jgi:hypothetical protein
MRKNAVAVIARGLLRALPAASFGFSGCDFVFA